MRIIIFGFVKEITNTKEYIFKKVTYCGRCDTKGQEIRFQDKFIEFDSISKQVKLMIHEHKLIAINKLGNTLLYLC